MKTVVLKFGGAAVAEVGCFSRVADIIAKRAKLFSRVAVVVSAMGTNTDQLIQLAQAVHPHPPKRELDMLISVGERVSGALLSMSLDLLGISAISFTGSQAGIMTTEEHAEAKIIQIRPHRIEREFEKGKVVIVAGFQGVSEKGEVTTLGRGGSDTSAVALAVALGADRVEFYKDVAGIGETNPKLDPTTPIYPYLTYEQATEIINRGAKVLHHRSVVLAKKNGVALEIRSFFNPDVVGTFVGNNIELGREDPISFAYEL